MSDKRNDIQALLIKKAWENEEFKKELLQNPKATIEKTLQIQIPEDVEIAVVQETPKKMYLVIPAKPEHTSSESSGNDPLALQTYVP